MVNSNAQEDLMAVDGVSLLCLFYGLSFLVLQLKKGEFLQ